MKQNETRREIMRALSLLTQLGLTMAACVFVGVFVGKQLDRFLGTAPVLLLVFAVIGAAAAFKALYDMVIRRYR